jgi:YafQ family addiction module toxin component
MVYSLEISEAADKIFEKLSKKNKYLLSIVNKKIMQILENPYHFKPLRGEMHGIRRVHIDTSFVLIYEVDEENKIVKILDYAHHDDVY